MLFGTETALTQDGLLAEIFENVSSWVSYIFGSGGPVVAVINFILANPFTWMFVGLGLFGIGIKLLGKIRRMFG